jgi:hypothetical protein
MQKNMEKVTKEINDFGDSVYLIKAQALIKKDKESSK